MKTNNKTPFFAIGMILLACIRYEYNALDSKFTYDGFYIGIIVIAVVSIILGFKLTTAWSRILLNKGVISNCPKHRFDILLPIGIIAASIGYTARGSLIKGIHDKMVPEWLFEWGSRTLNGYFLITLIAFVLLLRVYEIVNSIEKESISNSQPCATVDARTSRT